jgi:hypothetical protein
MLSMLLRTKKKAEVINLLSNIQGSADVIKFSKESPAAELRLKALRNIQSCSRVSYAQLRSTIYTGYPITHGTHCKKSVKTKCQLKKRLGGKKSEIQCQKISF